MGERVTFKGQISNGAVRIKTIRRDTHFLESSTLMQNKAVFGP